MVLTPQGCSPSGEEANGRCAMSARLSGLMQQAADRVFALLAFSARDVLHGHNNARHARLGIAAAAHCQGSLEINNVNASSKAPSPKALQVFNVWRDWGARLTPFPKPGFFSISKESGRNLAKRPGTQDL